MKEDITSIWPKTISAEISRSQVSNKTMYKAGRVRMRVEIILQPDPGFLFILSNNPFVTVARARREPAKAIEIAISPCNLQPRISTGFMATTANTRGMNAGISANLVGLFISNILKGNLAPRYLWS